MPELPVLGPTGDVGIGGDIPRIPRRLPISEAISSGVQDITNQAVELAKGIRAQKLKQADADATIEYTDRINTLRKNIDAEPDLDKQAKLWNDGINQIKDDFRKQAPNLGTLTIQSMSDKISNDDREFFFHNTEQKVKKGVSDVNRGLDDFTRLIGNATDKHTQDMLLQQGFKLIDDTKKNGFLDGPTAADLKDKFQTNARVEVFTRFAIDHPDKALLMHPDDVPIPATKFFDIQGKALAQVEGKHTIAYANGEILLNNLRINKALKEEAADSPANEAFTTSSIEQMQRFQGKPEEFDKWWLRNVAPHLYDLNKDDRYQLLQERGNVRRGLKDDFTNYGNDRMNEMNDTIDERVSDPSSLVSTMPEKFTHVNRFITGIRRDTRQRIREAKSYKEIDDIISDANKKIDSKFKEIEGGDTTTPAKPGAAAEPHDYSKDPDRPPVEEGK